MAARRLGRGIERISAFRASSSVSSSLLAKKVAIQAVKRAWRP